MKSLRNAIVMLMCQGVLLPIEILYRLRVMGFDTVSKALGLIPGLGGMWLRRAWYKATLLHCGENLYVDFLAAIRTPKTEVGHNVYIGNSCWIGWADIGDDVLLGGHIVVLSGARQHEFMRTDIPIRLQEGQPIQVRIGPDAWIGNGAIIAADVAKGCVVGAGSVVTQATEPYTVVAGVPARVIRRRDELSSQKPRV